MEFPGAFYHVLARGDRREPIVEDDQDRATFMRTLSEACGRSGFRVHGYALLTNHYHLLLETPEPNLSAGMGWFQNAYTRRINVRHRLWGHLFGGRYKAILVEPGECFSVLLDYIHLNPVRACLVDRKQGLESYRWTSLGEYLLPAKKRSAWFDASLGLRVNGCVDTPSGRRQFLELLEERVDWEDPENAGVEDGGGEVKLAPGVNVRRGWFFGSQEFGEEIQKHYSGLLRAKHKRREDGYTGGELRDHGERYATALVEAGLIYFGVGAHELSGMKFNDWRKGVIAESIQAHTTMKLDWICEKLHMGGRSNCARTIRATRLGLSANRQWSAARRRISKSIEIHD